MSELNTAKANLASAQSSLNYQSANMSRYQPLYKKGLVSACLLYTSDAAAEL